MPPIEDDVEPEAAAIEPAPEVAPVEPEASVEPAPEDDVEPEAAAIEPAPEDDVEPEASVEPALEVADQGMGVGPTEFVAPPEEDDTDLAPTEAPDATLLRETLGTLQETMVGIYQLGVVLSAMIAALQPYVPALTQPVHPSPPPGDG